MLHQYRRCLLLDLESSSRFSLGPTRENSIQDSTTQRLVDSETTNSVSKTSPMASGVLLSLFIAIGML